MININEYYVYEWFIVDTGEVFYVGKGKGNRYKKTTKRNKFFTNMYTTHRCDVRIVFNNLTEDEAFQKEKERIAYYRENTNFRLTNVTDGGEGISGWNPPQEFRDKQSKIHKAQWQNAEYRNRIVSARHDPNSTYQSEEFKNKISKLVSGTKNPNYGNHWTEEQKHNLSVLRKENGLSSGINNVKATSIICLETGEVFPLIKDAMKKYGVTHEGSFTVALKTRYKTAASLHWLKYNDRLLDQNTRFYELLISLSQSPRFPIICVQTKEIYPHRNAFLKEFHMKAETFKEKYDGKIEKDNKEFMYVTDYLSRICE